MKKLFILMLILFSTAPSALQTNQGSTPIPSKATTLEEKFFEGAKNGNLTQLSECLAAGVNLDSTDENGMTALMYAAEKNHPKAVNLLISHGADIEVCHYRATALVYAVFKGNTACVKALLDAGASTNICLRFNGDQGILHLVPKEKTEILQMLIKAKAPLNQTDDGGHTPLMWAILEKNLTFTTLLLNAGANPDLAHYNLFGFAPITPLMAAARDGFTEGVKALLKAKANKTLKDKNGKTAFDYAATKEIKALLKSK